MVKGLRRFLRTCLLGLLPLLLLSSPAWADKVAEPVVFDAGSGAIAVVSLYETDPATQADAVKSFYKLTKSFYKTIPGFYGLALFSSVDGSRVVELSQWVDTPSYEVFQASLTSGEDDYSKYYEKYSESKSSKGKSNDNVGLGEPFLTASFAIDQAVSPLGMVSVISGGAALVQIAEFSADSSDQQADLIAAAQAAFADLPQLYPAPRTAVLLKGIDTTDIALLANWGSIAEFSDLDQVPQIALTSATPDLDFTVDSHLYQTVKVITPKVEKYGKG
jgi:hypothetical protein